MPSAGPNFAGAGSGWTNSGNITADDGAYATATWIRTFSDAWEPTPTPYLTGSNFGFALGAGDTVNGVTVTVKAKRSAAPDGILNVFLAVGGVQKGGAKSATLNSSGDTVFTFGSSSDSWGASLVGADINSLQVVVYGNPNSGSGSSTVSVDAVKVAVDYGDSTPNAFSFTPQGSVPPSTVCTSNSVTIGGITVPAAVTVSGDATTQWEKNGSGTWSSSPGTVVNGDTVRVRVTSSSLFNQGVTATLTVGGVNGSFFVTTFAADTTPDAFSFVDRANAEPGLPYQSPWITVSGINQPATLSVTGGFVSVNGSAFNITSGTVNNGDQVSAYGVANAAFGGTTNVAVTIGGVSDTFTIATRVADTTPNTFTWTDQGGVATNSLCTSNTITVTGIEAAANVTFSTSGGSNHKYSKNGGAFTAVGAITVNNGDTLQLQLNAPASSGQTGNITVNIGGVVDTFTVDTTADTTPNAFSFTTQNNAVPGNNVTSNTVTITGINVATAVNVDQGALVSINAGGFASSGSVNNGDTLAIKVRTPVARGGSVTVNVTVGTVTVPWTVNNLKGIVDGDL